MELFLRAVPQPFKNQHGQVVALLGISDEAVDGCGHVCDEALGGSVLTEVGQLRQDPFLLEQFSVAPGGFRQSVRIQEEGRTRRQSRFLLGISPVRDDSDRSCCRDDSHVFVGFSCPSVQRMDLKARSGRRGDFSGCKL